MFHTARTIEALTQALTHAQQTIQDQAQIIADMKRQGFVQLDNAPPPEPALPPLDDDIGRAIDERALDEPTARKMHAFAERMLKKGVSGEEIERMILEGEAIE